MGISRTSRRQICTHKKCDLDFESVVLTGGQGSRLLPLTYELPKALIPIGGRPMLHFILDEMYFAGAHEVTILINDGTSRLIREHLIKIADEVVTQWTGMQIKVVHQPKTLTPVEALLKYTKPDRTVVVAHCDEIVPSEILHSLVKESESRNSIGIAIFNTLGRKSLTKVSFSVQDDSCLVGNSVSTHVAGRYIFPAKSWDTWKAFTVENMSSSILESCRIFGINGGNIIGLEFDYGYYDFGTLELYKKNIINFAKDQR